MHCPPGGGDADLSLPQTTWRLTYWFVKNCIAVQLYNMETQYKDSQGFGDFLLMTAAILYKVSSSLAQCCLVFPELQI